MDRPSHSLPAATIYADGACEGNPGRGGWAAIVQCPAARFTLSGGVRRTTNNRMELQAVIAALRSLGLTRFAVTIVSDSRYVVDAIDQGWLNRWVRAGFVKPNGERRDNADLWSELHQLLPRHAVRMTWIRGHAGHPENEECDRQAVSARGQANLPPDAGYEETHGAPWRKQAFPAA